MDNLENVSDFWDSDASDQENQNPTRRSSKKVVKEVAQELKQSAPDSPDDFNHNDLCTLFLLWFLVVPH